MKRLTLALIVLLLVPASAQGVSQRIKDDRMERCTKNSHVTVASNYDDQKGYRSDRLFSHPNNYAELSNNWWAIGAWDFSALGGLPYKKRMDVWRGTKPVRIYKRDIGAGGRGKYLNGKYVKRGLDIHIGPARKIPGLIKEGLVFVRYSFNRCY